MNKFFNTNSRAGFFFVLLCATALLADAGNVTDWFPGCSTIHFEEGDGLAAEAQIASVSAGATLPLGLYVASGHQHVSTQAPPAFKRVVFDQDSPSLEAASVLHAIFWSQTPEEKKLPAYNVSLSSPLYLEHCSLLI